MTTRLEAIEARNQRVWGKPPGRYAGPDQT